MYLIHGLVVPVIRLKVEPQFFFYLNSEEVERFEERKKQAERGGQKL